MEVLNKLKDTLSQSVTSTYFTAANQISNVLPGNPVTREFEVVEHIASAGPGLLWKVYKGYKKSTKQPAAVFVFEKKCLERFDRQTRDFFLDLFRKAISQLTRLRHPQILTVQHPLEESRDCLAFATEPVYCSLANILGRYENLPSPTPAHIRDYKMFDVEIKYGLLQLCEGFSFLHESVKLIHRNVSPESIIINHQGAWKIFGFDFCIPNSAPQNEPPRWMFPEYDHATPPEGYPDLDFLAPEYALAGLCTPAADMFSLGMIAFSLYNTKPLFTNSSSWGVFKKNACELKTLRESNLQLIPADLKEYLKMLLNVTAELRPDAAQFAKIAYFDDVGVKTLNNLDSQFQWDNLQKSQFYKGLPHIIPKLPHRVALHRVVPCLAKEYVNPHMIPFVLPSVLMIAEESSGNDFVQYILPELKTVMKITDPVQILLIFMQRMEMLLSKTPPTDVKTDVLPMIYRALESDTPQIQELCLSIIPGFAGLLDYQAMKNALLPRVKRLCTTTSLLSVRVNSLICIGKLLQHLDKWLVIDEILPMLQQIPSREPAVIMGIIGIYKMTMNEAKLGLTKEVLATKALPFLIPLSIENGITVNQFSSIMALIKEMLTKVEDEHRVKLEQLNSIQNEQRSALQISMSENLQTKPGQLISSPENQSDMDRMFSGLGLDSYIAKKDTGALATSMLPSDENPQNRMKDGRTPSPQHMTLEEKQRILRQSETMQRMKTQPKAQLTPMQSATKPSNQPTKDLTKTLMESNLSQMKSSQSLQSFPARAPQPNYASFGAPSSSQFNSMPATQVPSFNQGFASWQPQPTFQQTPVARPDLSAFDSLLPSKPKPSMNQLTSMNQMMSSTNNVPFNASATSTFNQQTQKQPVKSLTTNDIADLLG